MSKPSPKLRARRRIVAAVLLAVALPPLLWVGNVYWKNLDSARQALPTSAPLAARERLLIFAPHPDDETLGAGGLIAQARKRGIPVRVIFFTNGDGSRAAKFAVELQQRRRVNFVQIAALRQKEALAAAKNLGVSEKDVVFLGYPDGGTKQLLKHWRREDLFRSPFTNATHTPYANARTKNAAYCGAQALDDVIGVLRDFKPTTVVTTHPRDTNTDHQAAYIFMEKAMGKMASHARLLTFVVHQGVWPAPYGYLPDANLAPPATLRNAQTIWQQTPLDDAARRAKKSALECYGSQLATTPRFLRSFVRRNELFGAWRGENLPVHSAESHPPSLIPRP